MYLRLHLISLATKQSESQLQVQEVTPVYAVVQPATTPIKATPPKKPLILLVFLLFSLFCGSTWVFYKEWILEIKDRLKR